jgi:hypothetical protein
LQDFSLLDFSLLAFSKKVESNKPSRLCAASMVSEVATPNAATILAASLGTDAPDHAEAEAFFHARRGRRRRGLNHEWESGAKEEGRHGYR